MSHSDYKPIISIGVPVYNGELHIGAVLESLTSQTFREFEIIISDNGSIDKTGDICLAYAARDKRIRYFRQAQNKGISANFNFVLDESIGKYFMWAAADDIRSADFLEVNYKYLERNSDYVASVSPVRFDNGAFDEIKMGDRSLDSEKYWLRIIKFLSGWHANGACYSLIRTDVIKNCRWLHGVFLGTDWAIVLHLARKGKTKRAESGWLILGSSGLSNSGDIYKAARINFSDLVLPFWRFTVAALYEARGAPMYAKIIVLARCLKMNQLALKDLVLSKLQKIRSQLLRK